MGQDKPQRTEDGRYLLIDGRRWLATDPSVPEALRAELVAVLMAGRRLVRRDGDAARPIVHDAKVALGERGEAWWEPTDTGRRIRCAAVIQTLLRNRPEGTMCPSEAARVIGADHWRALMPLVREVAVAMRDHGTVQITQRGCVVDQPAPGPIRLRAAPGLEPRL